MAHSSIFWLVIRKCCFILFCLLWYIYVFFLWVMCYKVFTVLNKSIWKFIYKIHIEIGQTQMSYMKYKPRARYFQIYTAYKYPKHMFIFLHSPLKKTIKKKKFLINFMSVLRSGKSILPYLHLLTKSSYCCKFASSSSLTFVIYSCTFISLTLSLPCFFDL